jgi:hypothetical protein
MDPIGFGFERYDAFGRRRDSENGQSIDATGSIAGIAGSEVHFDGVRELSTWLAASDEVNACMLRYWAYFAFGRASWAEDGCTYDAIREDAAKNGFTVESVAMAIVHAPHFTRRVDAP